MANDGSNNWAKPYMPGRETPMSLLRFSPHDEGEKATELKAAYPKARTRKKRRVPSSQEAAFALVYGRQ
jgi:hypothetical protein